MEVSKRMRKEIIVLGEMAYVIAIIIISCYMTVNYGWYWIFLLIFSELRYNEKEKDGG